jgi:hypothetical protein
MNLGAGENAFCPRFCSAPASASVGQAPSSLCLASRLTPTRIEEMAFVNQLHSASAASPLTFHTPLGLDLLIPLLLNGCDGWWQWRHS